MNFPKRVATILKSVGTTAEQNQNQIDDEKKNFENFTTKIRKNYKKKRSSPQNSAHHFTTLHLRKKVEKKHKNKQNYGKNRTYAVNPKKNLIFCFFDQPFFQLFFVIFCKY